MSTGSFDLPGKSQQQDSNQAADTQKDVQISQPHNDRPQGPFEHSGETSGWTKAEESEKNEEEQV